jgi:hypothetical protein
MKKIMILCLTLMASFSSYSKEKQFIARKDLKLSLERPEKNLSGLFGTVKCYIKRMGTNDIEIQRGEVLQITKIGFDRAYFGTRTAITSTWSGEKVPQRVSDKFAGVYTFSLKLDENRELEMSCVGEKTKIQYGSSDSSTNWSGIPSIYALNEVRDLTYEEIQGAIENYFEVQ